MLKTLAKSIRENKRNSILTPIFVSFEVIIECIIPFIIADTVNRIKAGCSFAELLSQGALLACLALLSLGFGAIAGITCARASCGFARNLRRDMYYNIQNYSFENIDRFSTSSLVTRLTTDVSNLQNAYMMLIRIAVRSPFMFVFAFVMAFVMGGRMAWIFVGVVPLLAGGLIFVISRAMPLFRRVFRKYDKLNESVQENVKGMRVVKSFVREDYEKEKFSSSADDVARDFTKAERILALNSPIMQFCLYCIMVFVMTFGSYTVITSRGADIDVGQFSALLTYGMMILTSLMMLSMIFVTLTMSMESARRICEVINEKSLLENPENPVFEVKDGSISFENVSFKYSENAKKYALSDINISIKSGETIGIVGGTGSSKSTLVQLISRLYDVRHGTVRVGGVDVRDYDLKTLRDAVATVLQKNVLFSGTVKENLRWGNADATDEQIIEAARLARADEFVEKFPLGYDTHIDQGGANVSGGQRQRLCIARALLKNPKILIMDDSTSALDTKTDAQIRKNMQGYIPATTKIIVAQRIQSVESADRIIVMDGGKIIAFADHGTLLSECEIYRSIYESQTKLESEAVAK